MSRRERGSVRGVAAWVCIGVALPACGLLSFGTESGNPTEQEMPDVPPNLGDGDGVAPDRSMNIPGQGSSAVPPDLSSSSRGTVPTLTATANDPPTVPEPSSGPPTAVSGLIPGVPSSGSQPNPGMPSTNGGGPVAPPPAASPTATLPTGSVGCDVAVCQQQASSEAARLATASSAPVLAFSEASCGGDGAAPGCTCATAEGAVTLLRNTGSCALEGRFDCLIAASEVPTCTPDSDAGAASCQGLCEQAADALAADGARSYAVEVLSAGCANGACTYVLQVDSAACFAGPLLDPIACP